MEKAMYTVSIVCACMCLDGPVLYTTVLISFFLSFFLWYLSLELGMAMGNEVYLTIALDVVTIPPILT